MNKPRYIIIHHSLTDDHASLANIGAIRRYHLSLGWRDVAYHYILERIRGGMEIVVGRMEHHEGAHARGFNDTSIGICVVHNGDEAPFDSIQTESLLELAHSLQIRYSIPRERVLGHRETPLGAHKSCPGKLVDMDEIRQMCLP